MTESVYRARQVGAKTNEVVNYHRDDEQPGKPLFLLIPGGLIALGSLGLIIYIAYQTWFQNQLAENMSISLIMLLAPFYIGGVFLFSYGYELYDLPRALRLTAIIVFVTVAAVVIVAVLAVLAGGLKGGSSSSSKSSSKSSSGSSSSSKPSAKMDSLAGFAGGVGAGMKKSSSSGSGSSSSGGYYGGGNIFVGGGGGTRVETREVTKEVVKEVPKEPMPITCPFCSTSYIPVEHKYICPNCGAATPRNLIEESQMPKSDKS